MPSEYWTSGLSTHLLMFIPDHFQLFYSHSHWTVEDDVANYIYFFKLEINQVAKIIVLPILIFV